MKTKIEAKESFTVANVILLNLSCFYFSYHVLATDLFAQTSIILTVVIVGLIIMPLLYKIVSWITRGFGHKVLSKPIFYSVFFVCSAGEMYLLQVFYA